MKLICVKCGRIGVRGFASLNENTDTYPPGRQELMCANRTACEKRQKVENAAQDLEDYEAVADCGSTDVK